MFSMVKDETEKAEQSVRRQREEPKRKPRSAGFWVLMVLALAASTLIAWDGFVTSPLYEAYWWISVEKYWLREFSDMPGVKAYAETLLEGDLQLLHHELQKALRPPYYPFLYFVPIAALLGVAVFGKRRNLRWQYAAIWFALAAVACAVASNYMQPKWL